MSRVIGQDLQASGVAQVIVVLKRPPQVAAAAGGAAAGIAPRGPMMDVPMHGIERHFRTSELSQDFALAASSLTAANATEPTVRYYPNLGVAFGTVDRAGLAALRADPAVASVQGAPKLSLIAPERIADAKLTVNRTWGLTALKAPDLWAKGFTGAGVLVGHLDTGVDGKHPALKDAIGHYAEFDLLGGGDHPDAGAARQRRARHAHRRDDRRPAGPGPQRRHGARREAGVGDGHRGRQRRRARPRRDGLGGRARGQRPQHVARLPRLVGGLHPDRADPAPPPGPAGLRGRQRGPGHEPVARQLPAGAVGRGDGQEPTRSPTSRRASASSAARPARARPHRPGRRRHLGQARRRLAGHGRDVDGDAAHRRPRRAAHVGTAEGVGRPDRAGDLRVVHARSVDAARSRQPRPARRASRHSPC